MGEKVIYEIEQAKRFTNALKHIKDRELKERILKQISKIIDNPEIGKPMRFTRKGTREVYIHPFRLSYNYSEEKKMINLLDLYHKDEQ